MAEILPEDGTAGTLIGRVQRKDGPSVVAVRADGVFDITAAAPTVADLCNAADPRGAGPQQGRAHRLARGRDPALLAPIDLQAIKAAGVTFAVSLLERLIEEHAKGDLSRAEQVRKELNSIIGVDVTTIKPGSPEAEALKKTLMARGAWSPYLEVGIGPYAEIFTKAPPMAAVGYGAEIGIRSDSDWNNPEPEVTLVVSAKGTIVGATLGNDVNLRDMEGRSALLLGIAKDNNASCAIGPFVRLFDATFTLDDVRKAKVELEVTGPDQFRLRGSSDLSKISRDPTDLVQPRHGRHAPVSRRHGADDRHAVRADRAAQARRPWLHPHGGRPGVDPLAQARHAHQPRQPLRQDRAVDVRRVGADAQSGGAGAAEVSDLTRLPASVLREQIAARKVSPVELTDAVLARAETLQPVLNCFITIAADQARAAAQAGRGRRHAGQAARPAARHSLRRQGPGEHRRRAHDLRLAACTRTTCPRKTPSPPRA